jgi:hypothetical protein
MDTPLSSLMPPCHPGPLADRPDFPYLLGGIPYHDVSRLAAAVTAFFQMAPTQGDNRKAPRFQSKLYLSVMQDPNLDASIHVQIMQDCHPQHPLESPLADSHLVAVGSP